MSDQVNTSAKHVKETPPSLTHNALIDMLVAEATARGYRRGVRDAADKVQSMRTSTTADAARAILTLLEKDKPSLSLEDKPA